jgi:hypothetical protein
MISPCGCDVPFCFSPAASFFLRDFLVRAIELATATIFCKDTAGFAAAEQKATEIRQLGQDFPFQK